MPEKTVSELRFEEYLCVNGYTDFEFEAHFEGRAKHPDYRLRWNDRELLFEVKQREGVPLASGASQFNPYTGIRDEINEGARKFQKFKSCSCSLVIANDGDLNTILHPVYIFHAMLGDGGFQWRASHDTTTDRGHDTVQSVLLPTGGKMVRYKTRNYQNTTISAVIALEKTKLHSPLVEEVQGQAIPDEECRLGQRLTDDQRAEREAQVILGWGAAEYGPLCHREPRVLVCENPGARIPLPWEIFCGPYDERWAIVDGTLTQVYAGVWLSEVEGRTQS